MYFKDLFISTSEVEETVVKYFHHWQNEQNLKPFELVFEDAPADYRLQPGETIEFVTNLVGVKYYDPHNHTAKWEILHTFRWQLRNPQQTRSKARQSSK